MLLLTNKYIRSSKNKKYHYIKLSMFNVTVNITLRVFR